MIIHLEDILKTSWKGLEDVLKTSFQDVLKTFRRRFDNVLAKHRGDIFLRRKQKTSSTGLHQDLLKRARCPPWTKDVNWTYIRHSEDVQGVFWTSYVHSIYVLCPGDQDTWRFSERHPNNILFNYMWQNYMWSFRERSLNTLWQVQTQWPLW